MLLHKLREAMAKEKEYRRDRRFARKQNGKRKVVVIVRKRGGNSVPAVSAAKAKLPPSFSFVLPRGLLSTPTRLHHGTTFMSDLKSSASTIKKRTRWMGPARTKPRSTSAAFAALKSASTITLRAHISSAMRRSLHGVKITTE